MPLQNGHFLAGASRLSASADILLVLESPNGSTPIFFENLTGGEVLLARSGECAEDSGQNARPLAPAAKFNEY
jgi:hypothetical protein